MTFINPTKSVSPTGSRESVAGQLAIPGGDAAESARSASSADFENFLKLLTAQLRNQDPLSPLDSTQFVAQLASFSTVEQLVGANRRLDELASAISGGGVDSFAPLLGREVEASGAPIWLGASPAEFRIEPDSAADAVEAIVSNASGAVVARLPVDNIAQRQSWNGATSTGVAPPGPYSIEAVYWREGAEIARRPASGFGIVEEIRAAADGAQVFTVHGLFARTNDIAGIRR